MKIVDTNSPDTGNQSFKLAQAINLNYSPKHMSISFCYDPDNYLKFPYMVKHTDPYPDWVIDWWKNADVIHGHAKWRRVLAFGLKYNQDAIKIIHQHGRFGSDVTPDMLSTSDRKGKYYRIVSTINLLRYVQGDPSRWLPTPMNVKMFDEIKSKYYQPHDNIRIVHAPTIRRLKNTDLFLEVMKRIQSEYKNVELIMIEDKSHLECLKIKCSADICFDQLKLQYGTNALESWCFNIPTIAGGGYSTQIKDVIGYLPYYEADENTLYDRLVELIEDESLRKDMAWVGRTYVEKYHDYPNAAKKAISIYEDARNLYKN